MVEFPDQVLYLLLVVEMILVLELCTLREVPRGNKDPIAFKRI